MPNYYDDDFEVQPKFKDGVKQKGNGGSKKNQIQRKKGSNSSKEIYNSKHIRIQQGKIEKCRLSRPKVDVENINDSGKKTKSK
jgi:hypothetical protein